MLIVCFLFSISAASIESGISSSTIEESWFETEKNAIQTEESEIKNEYASIINFKSEAVDQTEFEIASDSCSLDIVQENSQILIESNQDSLENDNVSQQSDIIENVASTVIQSAIQEESDIFIHEHTLASDLEHQDEINAISDYGSNEMHDMNSFEIEETQYNSEVITPIYQDNSQHYESVIDSINESTIGSIIEEQSVITSPIIQEAITSEIDSNYESNLESTIITIENSDIKSTNSEEINIQTTGNSGQQVQDQSTTVDNSKIDENTDATPTQSTFFVNMDIITLILTLLLIAIAILVSAYYCRHLKFRDDDEIEFTRAIIGDDAFEFSQMATI